MPTLIASVYMFACVTLRTVTRAQREDVAARIFVAAQVSSGLYVDGWDHLSSVPLGYAIDRLRAVLEWDTEVLDRVFQQLQLSDDIKALDAMMSEHGDKVVCVSNFTTISAYIEAVGIRL
jgi:phosphoserine phosphatase